MIFPRREIVIFEEDAQCLEFCRYVDVDIDSWETKVMLSFSWCFEKTKIKVYSVLQIWGKSKIDHNSSPSRRLLLCGV